MKYLQFSEYRYSTILLYENAVQRTFYCFKISELQLRGWGCKATNVVNCIEIQLKCYKIIHCGLLN